MDRNLGQLIDGLTPEECRNSDALREEFCKQVGCRIDEILANDRRNLAVTELSGDRLKKDLAYYQAHGAAEDAIRILFDEDEPDFQFRSCYSLGGWSEGALLAYLQSPEIVIQTEAEEYIRSHQEEILLHYGAVKKQPKKQARPSEKGGLAFI